MDVAVEADGCQLWISVLNHLSRKLVDGTNRSHCENDEEFSRDFVSNFRDLPVDVVFGVLGVQEVLNPLDNNEKDDRSNKRQKGENLQRELESETLTSQSCLRFV